MRQNKLFIFSIVATLGMFIVILMGALVTNTGSANGCGRSWPLCYGEVVPSDVKKETLIEFSHRIISGLMGLIVIIHAIWSWLRYAHIKWTKLLAVLSVFFVAFQGLLGGAAVIWQQSSFILALHFGFSLISFASVLMLTIIVYEQTRYRTTIRPKITTAMRLNLTGMFIYLYLLIYSGAFVRHTDSALGCRGWPLCNGEWIPELYSRAGVQFIHRVLAGVLIIWLATTFIRVVLKYRDEVWLYWGITLSIGLILLQAFTGAMVVLTLMDISFLLLHASFVTLLFGALGFLVMIAWRKPRS
ncbi:COX15/CtaA family protein [Tuberibacillus sp. Marseille-P3662]|uniref:COX15/CtaA family protein n=1 Tax=Tuberibacillus sp. Marseille-P3662 TaxID=1965358 RepID=UPI000A1CE3EB|nr:heme A synthase [Tuberibacillus sp. Marseille-P3662]